MPICIQILSIDSNIYHVPRPDHDYDNVNYDGDYDNDYDNHYEVLNLTQL